MVRWAGELGTPAGGPVFPPQRRCGVSPLGLLWACMIV